MVARLIALILAQAAAPTSVVQLDPAEEDALALSAAPEHLRAGAGIYRLTAGGYVRVRPSANAFDCLVAREPNLGLAPVCYDAEGSLTNMQADMLRGKLRQEGKGEEDVEATVAKAYADKSLVPPSRPGIAYMLSRHFTEVSRKTGKRQCVYPPHVMFYAPFLKNSDIGAERQHMGSFHQPWVLSEGKPNAHILLVAHGTDTESCR